MNGSTAAQSPDAAEIARPNVLLVDDDPRILAGLRRQLHRRFHVFTAENGQAGLDLLATDTDFAVVVSDMRMPGMDGATFLARVRIDSPQSTRVLLTGQTELGAAVRAINDGQIFRFLNKPCPPEVLDRCLHEAVVRHRAAQDEHRLLSTVLGDRRVMETNGMYEAIAAGLQVGPQNQQFRLQYEPIVDLRDARAVAVEAVVRWNHPGGGLVRMSAPCPAIDPRGLQMPLGRWMMAAACQEVASWPVAATDALRVHIKLSEAQLSGPQLLDDLARTLILSGLEPHRLTLEVEESSALGEAVTIGSLRNLAQWGIQLALVVFGAGPTLPSLVERLKVDAVKIDAGLISSSGVDGRGVVEDIVAVAKQFQVLVMTAGATTVEQEVAARALGCDLAQGSLYGVPADPGDLLAGFAEPVS
jgi:EAL domain-containing protein (putative c-di-GMP-specific phosphodiesterase class I)/ActR/RegA family two-component response regulator